MRTRCLNAVLVVFAFATTLCGEEVQQRKADKPSSQIQLNNSTTTAQPNWFDRLGTAIRRQTVDRLIPANANDRSRPLLSIEFSIHITLENKPTSDRPTVASPSNIVTIQAPAIGREMNVEKNSEPNLSLKVTKPEAVRVGENVPIQIEICNTGSKETEKIELKVVMSDGFSHPEGKDIHAWFPQLLPGKSKAVTLQLRAVESGEQSLSVSARAEGISKVENKIAILIQPAPVPPKLRKLLGDYKKACEQGDLKLAKKLAGEALEIDPACFQSQIRRY